MNDFNSDYESIGPTLCDRHPVPAPRWLPNRYRYIQPMDHDRGQPMLVLDDRGRLCSIQSVLQTQPYAIGNAVADMAISQGLQRLAELNHPQIPSLLDAFVVEGQWYLVQDWIDGQTLAQELDAAGPFSEAAIWELLQALLPVLQLLHDRQIIHRDIKPGNVLRRSSDRQVLLLNFAAAQYGDYCDPLATALIGSAEYAAPEQIRGRARAASDLYSLGVTCLHLLTQMPPFDLYGINEDPWWLTDRPISSALRHILCRLQHPDTQQRYQSASAVLADLNAVLGCRGNHASIEPTATAGQISDNALLTATIATICAAQPRGSITAATVYLAQTQGWYHLSSAVPPATASVLHQNTAAPVGATLAASLVGDNRPASLHPKTSRLLPFVWRAVVLGTGTAIACIAITCLVTCISIIVLTLSMPLPSCAIALKHDRPAFASR